MPLPRRLLLCHVHVPAGTLARLAFSHPPAYTVRGVSEPAAASLRCHSLPLRCGRQRRGVRAEARCPQGLPRTAPVGALGADGSAWWVGVCEKMRAFYLSAAMVEEEFK